MTRFACENCNFRFESSFEQEGKSCPYCGEKKVKKEKELNDLIKEC